MNVLTARQFDAMIKDAPIKPRFKRDLKFVTSTEHLIDDAWANKELLPIWNKSKNNGILIVQPDDMVYMIAFDASKPLITGEGRTKPIICDLCYTWRKSGQGGFVTFYPDKGTNNSISLLCCTDLLCSDHVRTLTPASLKSRTQLREHMTNEDRVERLRMKLREFTAKRGLMPLSVTE